MRQLFNCFKTWSCSRVEQMQRTQLIIFFYYVENRILFDFYWSLLKYLYDKIQIKFDLYFFVNDTNDRSFYTCY